MLQIRSKDRQSISSDGPSLISNRRNSTVSETDPESDDFFLISSDGIAEGSTERNVNDGLESEKVRSILSYFVLNENHIRKLFQVSQSITLCSLTLALDLYNSYQSKFVPHEIAWR